MGMLIGAILGGFAGNMYCQATAGAATPPSTTIAIPVPGQVVPLVAPTGIRQSLCGGDMLNGLQAIIAGVVLGGFIGYEVSK